MLSQHRYKFLAILASTCVVLAYFVIRPGYLNEIYQSNHGHTARTALQSLLQSEPEMLLQHESPYLTKLHKHLLSECRPPPRWFQFGAKKQIVPAFLISAHDEATIDGAAELLGQIYHPSDVFVLHVDAKVSDSAYEDLLSSIPDQCTNIEFVEERVDVGWGDWGIVEMELRMLRVAWEMEQEWDMAFLMDGSTWPLTTRQQRQAWMQKLPVGSSSAASARLGDLKAVCAGGKPAHYCHRTPARCKDEECLQMTLTPGGRFYTLGVGHGAESWLRGTGSVWSSMGSALTPIRAISFHGSFGRRVDRLLQADINTRRALLPLRLVFVSSQLHCNT